MTIFGAMVSSTEVETAVLDVLQEWFPTYCAEFERQHAMAARSLPQPRSWRRRNEYDRWPEDQVPAIVVVSPGLAAKPVREGGGSYRATWLVGVAVVARARDQQTTRDVVRAYAAIIRALLLQRGVGDGVEWLDESYTDTTGESERSEAVGRVAFEVEFRDMAYGRGHGAPDATPLVDPYTAYDEWPTVLTTGLEVGTL